MARRSKKPASSGGHPEGWEYADDAPRRVRSRGGRRSAPPGKRRLRLASDPEKFAEIKLIIENWPLKNHLDWDVLMSVINRRYHGDWTRQAVAAKKDLQRAFTKRLGEIREANPKGAKKARKTRTRDEEVVYLKRQLDAANKEIDDLKVKYAILENRLTRWRHNALEAKMTIADLDEPVQENNRRRSDR